MMPTALQAELPDSEEQIPAIFITLTFTGATTHNNHWDVAQVVRSAISAGNRYYVIYERGEFFESEVQTSLRLSLICFSLAGYGLIYVSVASARKSKLTLHCLAGFEKGFIQP